MKKFVKIFTSMLCAVALAIPLFVLAACGSEKEPQVVDYVSQVKLDFTSESKKQEVKVRLYIDGDTTHFDPVDNSEYTGSADDFSKTQGYIKARYLAINTPESTGKIEKWGKKASNFTHDKLASASTGDGAIIVESDTDTWNLDSTGGRYTLWVWYKPDGETEFRNLNIEILQEGLALASNSEDNRYGEIAGKAIAQARTLQRYVFAPADTVDPDWDNGPGAPVTLKALRADPDAYVGKKVIAEGIIVAEFSNSVYIEDYDAETGVHFGMAVYYGFQSGALLRQLKINHKIKVVGTFSEFQGTYQISGISYNEYKPEAASNTVLLDPDTEYFPDYAEVTAKDVVSGKVNFELGDESYSLDYGDAITASTVSLNNLTVTKTYTTHNGGDNDGAVSITCKATDGTTITVRTEVLFDSKGELINGPSLVGKTINVKGIIEKYDGNYQVKVYLTDFIMNVDGTPVFD